MRPEFGTGAVKITPAHDPDDYATGRRHELPMINVFDDAGRINEHGAGYRGLPLAEARKRILADLEARGDLLAAVPHEMLIGRCQRSNDIIEPRLKTQWFIRTQAPRRAGPGGHPQRADPDRARPLRGRLGALADRTSATGTSAASCGGATGSRPGTAPTGTSP